MNKTELWNEVSQIIEAHKISKEAATALEELLKPRKGGSATQRIVKEVEGVIYKNCRFTNRLFPESELIYQNEAAKEEGKDKGYSKIGISLWSKGQKYIKNLENEIVKDVLDNKDTKEQATELQEIKKNNHGNQPEWLAQFLTDAQVKELEEVSLPIENS